METVSSQGPQESQGAQVKILSDPYVACDPCDHMETRLNATFAYECPMFCRMKCWERLVKGSLVFCFKRSVSTRELNIATLCMLRMCVSFATIKNIYKFCNIKNRHSTMY